MRCFRRGLLNVTSISWMSVVEAEFSSQYSDVRRKVWNEDRQRLKWQASREETVPTALVGRIGTAVVPVNSAIADKHDMMNVRDVVEAAKVFCAREQSTSAPSLPFEYQRTGSLVSVLYFPHCGLTKLVTRTCIIAALNFRHSPFRNEVS